MMLNGSRPKENANPDLDCGNIPYQRLIVMQPVPHRFDCDNNGIGCES